MRALDIRPDGDPCVNCGIPLVSQRTWQKLPREMRQELLKQRALSGRRAHDRCNTCLMREIRSGTYIPGERKKYVKYGRFSWPAEDIELTGGRWVVRRGIRVWEPTKVRSGAASR